MSDAQEDTNPALFRSGFVAMFGRPNTGKSTIVNQIVGRKISITSDKAQTTRHQIRGVLTRDDGQVVFVDTPGVGKPRTALGERLNRTAGDAQSSVDLTCFVVDARSGYGRGDAFLAKRLVPEKTVVVINKVDGMNPESIGKQLLAVAPLDASSYFPVSGFTGEGIPQLVDHLMGRMPEGPLWFPAEVRSDTPEQQWVAELVREQLLRTLREEVPHSVATRVVEWEERRIRVEILVERDSQKGIVIGKGGSVLKEVGTKVRRQLPKKVHLELFVTVDSNWQQDPAGVERLGY